MAWGGSEVEPPPEDARARDRLASFRRELYGCFTARADALFELEDAVLCADGPVKTLVGLSLAPEHQRGHGALYDAVNCGRVEIARLRRAVAGLPLPGWGDGRIRLGVDVSPWLRPGAATSPDRLFCHVSRRGKGQGQVIPGRPEPVGAALEPGRTTAGPRGTGPAVAGAWNRLPPRPTHRAAREDHSDGERPIIEGPLTPLTVDHLPGDRDQSRCGCGSPAPALPPPTRTGCGRRSCAGSTSSTTFSCSSRFPAGPRRRFPTPPPLTSGRRYSTPPPPSSAPPPASPPASAALGNRTP